MERGGRGSQVVRVLKARLKVDQHAEEIGAGLVSGEGDFRGNLSQGTEVAVLEAKWGSRLLENASFSFVLIVGFRASCASPVWFRSLFALLWVPRLPSQSGEQAGDLPHPELA